jgi:membrane dipeptidase
MLILRQEGAASLVDVSYLHRAYEYGLRAVRLSHFGSGRYARGTKIEGPLTPLRLGLLKEMSKLKLILDVTHLNR